MARTRSLAGHPASGMDRHPAVRTLLAGTGAGLALPGLAVAHPLVQRAHPAGRSEEAQTRVSDPGQSPEFLDDWAFGMPETLGERIGELVDEGPVFTDSFPGCPHPEGHE